MQNNIHYTIYNIEIQSRSNFQKNTKHKKCIKKVAVFSIFSTNEEKVIIERVE